MKEYKIKKSFLEILEEEKEAVIMERHYADSIKEFESLITDDLETCKRICGEQEQKRKEEEKKILSIREEMKEYLNDLIYFYNSYNIDDYSLRRFSTYKS